MRKAAKRALLLLCFLGTPSCFNTSVDPTVGLKSPVRSPEFPSELSRINNTPWIPGNQIRTLPNGDAFFPPMLVAIAKARTSITFETFAFVNAPITTAFSTALAAKAREGVAVHMILDDTGSRKAGEANVKLLRESGVQLHFFHPINPLFPRISNNRTHRKILVVDGHTAFTGGAGFAFAWTGNAHTPKHWRDTMYEIRGPAVAEFQKSFSENWHELTGVKLQGSSYFPNPAPAGPYRVQVISDGPAHRAHHQGGAPKAHA